MTDMIFSTDGEESFRIPPPFSHNHYVGTKCPETKLEIKKMTDEEFLKQTATKVANILHMPLGDIEPIKLIQMVVSLDILLGGDKELMIHWISTYNNHLKFCPGAYLTSEYHMNKILGYLDAMVEH
jgi:hypothetical protein